MTFLNLMPTNAAGTLVRKLQSFFIKSGEEQVWRDSMLENVAAPLLSTDPSAMYCLIGHVPYGGALGTAVGGLRGLKPGQAPKPAQLQGLQAQPLLTADERYIETAIRFSAVNPPRVDINQCCPVELEGYEGMWHHSPLGLLVLGKQTELIDTFLEADTFDASRAYSKSVFNDGEWESSILYACLVANDLVAFKKLSGDARFQDAWGGSWRRGALTDDSEVFSLIAAAVYFGRSAFLDLLLERHRNGTPDVPAAAHAMCIAAYRGDTASVEKLMQLDPRMLNVPRSVCVTKGASYPFGVQAAVEATVPQYAATPLYFALAKHHVKLVQKMLACPTCSVSLDGVSSAEALWLGMSLSMARTIAGHHTFPLQQIIHLAAQHSKLDFLEYFLKRADPGSVADYASQALHIAVVHGQHQVVDYLFAAFREHVNINYIHNCTTALYEACVQGEFPMVQFLCQQGHQPACEAEHTPLDVHVGFVCIGDGVEKESPLFVAARRGHINIARRLLKHPNINVTVGYQRDNGAERQSAVITPEQVARRNGHDALAALFAPKIAADTSSEH